MFIFARFSWSSSPRGKGSTAFTFLASRPESSGKNFEQGLCPEFKARGFPSSLSPCAYYKYNKNMLQLWVTCSSSHAPSSLPHRGERGLFTYMASRPKAPEKAFWTRSSSKLSMSFCVSHFVSSSRTQSFFILKLNLRNLRLRHLRTVDLIVCLSLFGAGHLPNSKESSC